jgi:hypothetical protein
MSTMIDRVGAAVLKDLLDRRGFDDAWDACDEETQHEIRQAIGSEAIKVMLKPTDAMKEAGVAAISKNWMGGYSDWNSFRDVCWRAMIEAALRTNP